MAYAEKQVNWKNELSETRKNASEARGSVESPQALAGESYGTINGA